MQAFFLKKEKFFLEKMKKMIFISYEKMTFHLQKLFKNNYLLGVSKRAVIRKKASNTLDAFLILLFIVRKYF